MPDVARAYLALGANLGDRTAALARGVRAIGALPGTSVVATSTLHETAALLPPGAPEEWDVAFLNQVIAIDTGLSPYALLAAVKAIERAQGRRPGPRWAPREIDIDILAHGDTVITELSLFVPHPGVPSRLFVLAPWLEIAPDWVHPVSGRTVAQMHDELASTS